MEAAIIKTPEKERYFLSADAERFVEFDRLPDTFFHNGEKQIFFDMWAQAVGEPSNLKHPVMKKRVIINRGEVMAAGGEVVAL